MHDTADHVVWWIGSPRAPGRLVPHGDILLGTGVWIESAVFIRTTSEFSKDVFSVGNKLISFWQCLVLAFMK
jgi:hypothetical protein